MNRLVMSASSHCWMNEWQRMLPSLLLQLLLRLLGRLLLRSLTQWWQLLLVCLLQIETSSTDLHMTPTETSTEYRSRRHTVNSWHYSLEDENGLVDNGRSRSRKALQRRTTNNKWQTELLNCFLPLCLSHICMPLTPLLSTKRAELPWECKVANSD